jgi:hypothetical protein
MIFNKQSQIAQVMSKNYVINNQIEPLEYNFNNKNIYKGITYRTSVITGDIKIQIIDNNNEITYESAWYKDINKDGKTTNFDRIVLLGLGNSTLIPKEKYRIKFVFREKTSGQVNITWKK